MYDTCYPSHGLSLPDVRSVLRAAKGVSVNSWRDAMFSHPALHTTRDQSAAARAKPLGQLNDCMATWPRTLGFPVRC
jgi:hypothetical protein